MIVAEEKKDIVIKLSGTEARNLYEDLGQLCECNTSTDQLREELEIVIEG